MNNDEAKLEKKVEELCHLVKSLRRIVVGLAVFFVTFLCFFVADHPRGEPAIIVAVIAIGIYWALLALGARLSQPRVRTKDES